MPNKLASIATFRAVSRIHEQEGSMKNEKTAALLVLSFVIGCIGPLRLEAQDRTDFAQLQTTVKQNDSIVVTTADGTKVKGKMLELSLDRIVVQMKNGARTVDARQITKVQKRKNGVLLGAIIGAGAMVPVSIAFAEYASNEGSGAAGAAVPIMLGLAIGTGIDAAIGSNKTLYDRNSKKRVTVSPRMDRKGGFGARLAFNF